MRPGNCAPPALHHRVTPIPVDCDASGSEGSGALQRGVVPVVQCVCAPKGSALPCRRLPYPIRFWLRLLLACGSVVAVSGHGQTPLCGSVHTCIAERVSLEVSCARPRSAVTNICPQSKNTRVRPLRSRFTSWALDCVEQCAWSVLIAYEPRPVRPSAPPFSSTKAGWAGLLTGEGHGAGMVMDLGLEDEQSEGETPEETALEEQVAPESQEEHTSALEAATAGDLKALEAALVRGDSTEQTDTLGRTPLLIAVQVSNPPSHCSNANVSVGSSVRSATSQTKVCSAQLGPIAG